MQYMILIYTEEFPAPAPGDPGFAEYMAPWAAFNEMHGTSIAGAAQLQPVATAKTIQRSFGGGDTTIDGPFAETMEVFGGYYLVEAPNLDVALEIAAAIPVPVGSLEVRPLVPGASG